MMTNEHLNGMILLVTASFSCVAAFKLMNRHPFERLSFEGYFASTVFAFLGLLQMGLGIYLIYIR